MTFYVQNLCQLRSYNCEYPLSSEKLPLMHELQTQHYLTNNYIFLKILGYIFVRSIKFGI